MDVPARICDCVFVAARDVDTAVRDVLVPKLREILDTFVAAVRDCVVVAVRAGRVVLGEFSVVCDWVFVVVRAVTDCVPVFEPVRPFVDTTVLVVRGLTVARSRTATFCDVVFVFREFVVVADGWAVDFCRFDVTVVAADVRRVAARTVFVASSAIAPFATSGARHAIKNSFIPFILYNWMLAK